MQRATTSRKSSLTSSLQLGKHSLPLLGTQPGLVFAERMDEWAGCGWCQLPGTWAPRGRDWPQEVFVE